MRYHDITKDDMLNGDGLRVVLWVSGCSHYCKECHNPVTWDPNGGLPFDDGAKAEIFEQLEKDYISGITVSGGDPLYSANIEPVTELLKEIKERFPYKTVWIYTGALWEEIWNQPAILLADILVDGEFHLSEKDKDIKWRGSKNQRVIDVKKTFNSGTPDTPILYCD